MRVSNQELVGSAAGFFQSPKVGKSDQGVAGEPSKVDPQDPASFSRLLDLGHSRADAKNVAPVRGRVAPTSAPSDRRTQSGSENQSATSVDSVYSRSKDAPSFSGATGKANGYDPLDRSRADLLQADELPADPRLQDPAELALEAAAAAAVAALSQKNSSSATSSDVSRDASNASPSPLPNSASGSPVQIPDVFLQINAPNPLETELTVAAALGLGKNVQPDSSSISGNGTNLSDGPSSAFVKDLSSAGVVQSLNTLQDSAPVNLQVSPQLLEAMARASRAQFAADQNHVALGALNGEYYPAPGEAPAVFTTQSGPTQEGGASAGSLLQLPAVTDVIRGSVVALGEKRGTNASDVSAASLQSKTAALGAGSTLVEVLSSRSKNAGALPSPLGESPTPTASLSQLVQVAGAASAATGRE